MRMFRRRQDTDSYSLFVFLFALPATYSVCYGKPLFLDHLRDGLRLADLSSIF
jgi:hypothetical protein